MDLLSDNTRNLPVRKITPRTNVYLSLYLVIFGFFVVLVNESELDVNKSEEAIASVKQTLFSNAQTGVSDNGAFSRVSVTENLEIQETKNVVSEFLPNAKFFVNAGQNLLRIELAANSLFFENTAAVRSEAKAAFAALSDQLASRDSDETIHITVPRRRAANEGEMGTTDANLRRAHILAELFQLPRETSPRLYTGYGRQNAGSVFISIQTNGASLRPVFRMR